MQGMDAHLIGHILLRILPDESQGDLAVPVDDALADAETWATVLGVSKVFGAEAARLLLPGLRQLQPPSPELPQRWMAREARRRLCAAGAVYVVLSLPAYLHYSWWCVHACAYSFYDLRAPFPPV